VSQEEALRLASNARPAATSKNEDGSGVSVPITSKALRTDVPEMKGPFRVSCSAKTPKVLVFVQPACVSEAPGAATTQYCFPAVRGISETAFTVSAVQQNPKVGKLFRDHDATTAPSLSAPADRANLPAGSRLARSLRYFRGNVPLFTLLRGGSGACRWAASRLGTNNGEAKADH